MEKITEASVKELERRVARLERIIYRFSYQTLKDLGDKDCCRGELLPIESIVEVKAPLTNIIG
ncbi:hypothetical protein [Pseudoramibacter alactolyticus]|uniref:hypothetical protein n=1 Tax=Pseudoramibacter alactolyticus TaxID=113287 RepID=UPI00248F2AFB|nr:hypothetical protein [Pseudoramibacter alactolyticus]